MDTPEQICSSVRKWMRENRITMTAAAARMGVTLSAVSNQLNGNRPFGRNLAGKYAKAFGFDVNYLLTGEGSLVPQEVASDDVLIPADTVKMYSDMAEAIRTLSALVERLSR